MLGRGRTDLIMSDFLGIEARFAHVALIGLRSRPYIFYFLGRRRLHPHLLTPPPRRCKLLTLLQVSNRFNLTFSFPELAVEGSKAGRPRGSSSGSSSSALLRTVLPANATEASRIVMAKHRDRLQDAADRAQP